jgi:dTDP-4-dehydrorhamnose 3,5-epimerase
VPFIFTILEIPEVVLIEPKAFGDDRGFFMETFKASEFASFGIAGNWVQDNHSRSKKGVLRGLHFQTSPHAQGKLVRVVAGAVFDVAVDIRKNSPTFGRWVGATLSAQNKHMLWIPQGFAHGVLTLEDNSDFLYKVSGSEYSPMFERSIRWNDPLLKISWPMGNPELSEKDRVAPTLAEQIELFE